MASEPVEIPRNSQNEITQERNRLSRSTTNAAAHRANPTPPAISALVRRASMSATGGVNVKVSAWLATLLSLLWRWFGRSGSGGPIEIGAAVSRHIVHRCPLAELQGPDIRGDRPAIG